VGFFSFGVFDVDVVGLFSGLLFVEILRTLADFVLEFFTGFPEFTDTLTHTARELREFLGTEEKEKNQEDENHLLGSE